MLLFLLMRSLYLNAAGVAALSQCSLAPVLVGIWLVALSHTQCCTQTRAHTHTHTHTQLEELLKCSLVLVDVDIPLVALSDGVHARSFAGNGLIVHHGKNVGGGIQHEHGSVGLCAYGCTCVEGGLQMVCTYAVSLATVSSWCVCVGDRCRGCATDSGHD